MERGSSVLEALVCLALVAIQLAIATPGLIRWREARALYESTEELRLALERSYIVATGFHEAVTVTFERDGRVIGRSASLPVFDLPPKSGIRRALKEVGEATLTFYPSRTATPGTILVSSKTRTCSLVLSLRGRIRRAC